MYFPLISGVDLFTEGGCISILRSVLSGEHSNSPPFAQNSASSDKLFTFEDSYHPSRHIIFSLVFSLVFSGNEKFLLGIFKFLHTTGDKM